MMIIAEQPHIVFLLLVYKIYKVPRVNYQY